jgi:Flp pilus assembly pilin Flp
MSWSTQSSEVAGETGATMVEYALVLGLIVAVAIGAVALIGGGTLALFSPGL